MPRAEQAPAYLLLVTSPICGGQAVSVRVVPSITTLAPIEVVLWWLSVAAWLDYDHHLGEFENITAVSGGNHEFDHSEY